MSEMRARDLLVEYLDILQGCDMIAWAVPPGSDQELAMLRGKESMDRPRDWGDRQMCPSSLLQWTYWEPHPKHRSKIWYRVMILRHSHYLLLT